MKRFLLLLLTTIGLSAGEIDVVIPCIAKDLPVIEYAIKGIRMNCKDVRRVIVVSPTKLTDSAEWFPESNFPFTKRDVEKRMIGVPENFWRTGWYLQQLLKFYIFEAIPDLTDDVLILDSDTVFYHPVEFRDEQGRILYCTGHEYHKAYFRHMDKFLPGLHRVHVKSSGISSHMLFNRDILAEIFSKVEAHHDKPLWKAFMDCVEPSSYKFSGASEYEIIFNYCLIHCPEKVKARKLKWRNMRTLSGVDPSDGSPYDFMSFHSWMRRH